MKLASLEQKLEDVKTAYLEEKLGEIKCLYFEKYGEELLDAEGEAVEDEDGAMWMQVSGDGTSSSQQFELTYRLNLASLEQKLEDVKAAYLEGKLGEVKYLYFEKYGKELLIRRMKQWRMRMEQCGCRFQGMVPCLSSRSI